MSNTNNTNNTNNHKSLKFRFRVTILNQPKERWTVLIVANRSVEYKPIVLVNTTKVINLTGNIEGFNNYLNLRRNNINNTILFFYSFIEDKNKELQINKCKKYNLVDLLSIKLPKQIKLKSIILSLKPTMPMLKGILLPRIPGNVDNNTQLGSMGKQISSRLSLRNLFGMKKTRKDLLDDYRHKVNDRLLQLADIKKGEIWHIIYYTLDVFRDAPIVSSIMMDNEQSNELFWENMYNSVKEIYSGFGVEWDPKTSWVNLLTAINNFAHNYVLENRDIYMESWFYRYFDCDESFMPYQLFQLFVKCKFSVNNDLKLIQSHYVKQYISFTAFWYVTNPSANLNRDNNSSSSQQKRMGHWIAFCILRPYFYDHCIGFSSPKSSSSIKGLDKVLFGESTAFLHPSVFKTPKKIRDFFPQERKFRFLKDSRFFVRTNTIYTTEFLDKYKIQGFYCFTRRGGKLTNGTNFKEFFGDLKNIVFAPFPKMSDELISYAKYCAEQRMTIPKFLCYLDKNSYTKNIKHYACFVTIENIKAKIMNIMEFFKKNFKLLSNFTKKHKKHEYYFVFSLDDLMLDNLREGLKKHFYGKEISVAIYELMYKTYTFAIKVL